MVEQYNHLWFSHVNAPAGLSGWPLLSATVSAEWLIWLIPVSLTLLWLIGSNRNRIATVRACLATAGALIINQGLALIYFHPRPFMEGAGHTFLPHVADSSFPSDHVTLMLSAGLVLMVSDSRVSRRFGGVLIALSPVVAWARIFLGVHYPLDMLGALGVAVCTSVLVNTRPGKAACQRLVTLLEIVYRQLLAKPIARGWVKS